MVYKELSDKGTLKIFKEIDLHRKNIQKKKKIWGQMFVKRQDISKKEKQMWKK